MVFEGTDQMLRYWYVCFWYFGITEGVSIQGICRGKEWTDWREECPQLDRRSQAFEEELDGGLSVVETYEKMREGL